MLQNFFFYTISLLVTVKACYLDIAVINNAPQGYCISTYSSHAATMSYKVVAMRYCQYSATTL